jgi:hypothetical protein
MLLPRVPPSAFFDFHRRRVPKRRATSADDAPTSDASSKARRAKNDDLVAKLRLGESADAGRAVKPTRLERAAARVNRERDAASMMPTMTTDAPTPQPVVSGVKRTMVAGTVKSATSDATRRGETAAEAQFTRDVERFVGRMSM